MGTTPAGRAVLKATLSLVEGSGGKCWIESARGAGHQRLVVEIGGRRRFSVISGSPRDINQVVKAKRSDVRKIIRDLIDCSPPPTTGALE